MNGKFYKGIAAGLLAIVLGYTGNVLAAQFDLRERVASLETAFQYVVEKIEHLDSHYHSEEDGQ